MPASAGRAAAFAAEARTFTWGVFFACLGRSRSSRWGTCATPSRATARRASGLYRFYLLLIADFWGRILVRRARLSACSDVFSHSRVSCIGFRKLLPSRLRWFPRASADLARHCGSGTAAPPSVFSAPDRFSIRFFQRSVAFASGHSALPLFAPPLAGSYACFRGYPRSTSAVKAKPNC